MNKHAAALYPRVLGSSWQQLAEPVRVAHTTSPSVHARARLRIEHGRGPLARLLARLLRLPRASDSSNVELVVTAEGDGERWRRTFEDRRFDTRQYQAGECVVAERIGIIEFEFQLDVAGGGLVFRQRRASFVFGSIRLPLPAVSAPRVDAREDAVGDRRLRIYVRVTVPMLGPVLTYEGTVDYEESPA